ncbi:uncharacterized protein V6R79_014057 [Siganus canaliculatus]
MATRPGLTFGATLMFLVTTWRQSIYCYGFTVDPPEDLVISDPGFLGHLDITWTPPASLVNQTQCPKHYQLEYFNSYSNSWNVIRTARRTFSAQFDLMKDVRVRVYTLLTGPCTNGSLVKSRNFTELVQRPPSTGIPAVQDFGCIYHNTKYVECSWGRSPDLPANSQLKLYFWHNELEHAQECQMYVISNGVRSGCNFTEAPLPRFTDINLCVNGSSPVGPLKPAFISLQIQNNVKPAVTEKLSLQTGPDAQLGLHWECPAGGSLGHCLEWEVEHIHEVPEGETSTEIISTKEMMITLPSIHGKERSCFRVRSKLNKYCAAKSFWSEWSHPLCYPEPNCCLVDRRMKNS